MNFRLIVISLASMQLLAANTSMALEQMSLHCVESVRGNPIKSCQQKCSDTFPEENVDSYLAQGWHIVRSVPVENTVEQTWVGGTTGIEYGCVCIGTRYTLQRNEASQPPDNHSSETAQNQVDGFRGNKWGSEMSSIQGLDTYSNKFDINRNQTGIFRPSKEAAKTNIGDAALDTVQYFFDDNQKFYGVFGTTYFKDFRKNGQSLLKAFTAKYGKPDKVIAVPNSSLTKRYFWVGKTIAIVDLHPDTMSSFYLVDSTTTYAKDLLAKKGFVPKEIPKESAPSGL